MSDLRAWLSTYTDPLYWRWRRATARFRACRIEDGYCLSHHTSMCGGNR